MLPKKGIWLARWLRISGLLLILSMSTAVAASSQDSWHWRLETERLTQEALAVQALNQSQLYRVKQGDTLWSLANGLGVDLGVLANMNYLSPEDTIYAGQQIRMPIEPDKKYQVRSKDTLWAIAQRFDVDVDILMNANRITKPEHLQVGRVLTIPGNPLAVAVLSRPETAPKTISRETGLRLNWPVTGRISSPYGARGKEFHHGMDIAAPQGTAIKAALGGEVIFSGYKNNIYGNSVEIRHRDGLTTLYAHNSKNLVKKGERVVTGQRIAQIGSTGKTTGPHLHFELRINGECFNPHHYLK